MTLTEYLSKKYGVGVPTTMLKSEARIFDIPYPLERGWLARYGDHVLTADMQARLIQSLQARGCPSAGQGLIALGADPTAKNIVAKTRAERRAAIRRASKGQKVAALAAKLVKPRPLGKSLPAVIHRPPVVGPRIPRCPDPNSDEFLSSYAWRQVRMQALKKYGPVCMCCGATPSTGAVMNVDHIKPRRLFPQLALDIDNLQILCGDCNHGKGNWDQTDWRPEEYEPEAVAHLRLIVKNG